jgi:chromosome segregation ATPase
MERARQALAGQQEQAEEELSQARNSLDERSAHLDRREETIEQVQADVARMHREALELRLATEQLWSQLSGVAAPAELAQSLARIQARLAEHQRLAEAGLAQKREELRSLAARLDERHLELSRQRADLTAWHASRHEELKTEAAQLAAQKQELDRQTRQLRLSNRPPRPRAASKA